MRSQLISVLPAINAAGFTNRVAHGCDNLYVRGLLGDIRRLTSPPRDHKLDGRKRVRLAQILTNLLSNCAKYTEPGGTISLTVERMASS